MTAFPPVLALVDFADETSGMPRRLLFDRPSAVHRAVRHADVVGVLEAAERAARDGRWVVGFVAFEAAAAFDPAFDPAPTAELPLAWFAEFDAPRPAHSLHESAEDDGSRLGVAEAAELHASAHVADAAFAHAVRRIQEYIASGDVYQVNLTVPFSAPLPGAPRPLYERMRRAQGGAYSCFIDIGSASIMCASPELFFERRGGRLMSRPMKGTAERAPDAAGDLAARDALVRSEKDRAENVMIVDVVRNDIGRIAAVGSVNVAALCVAERYPSVWQLTSTVEGDLRPDVALVEIFRALFPPASVTGAPKIRAVKIIRELEQSPRGVYCGAVGLVRPGGDATFNVAIRTAWTIAGSGAVQLHAGGGITADSTERGELGEVRAKLASFTRPVPRPDLFETIRVEGTRFVRLERHLARMAASAAYFAIPFDPDEARRVLARTLDRSPGLGVARARLDLSSAGALTAVVRPHDDVTSRTPQVVVMASAPVDPADVALYHKCADRTRYDAALAAAPHAFDALLWNVRGEVTELTRGNLVVELDGRRVTPPVASGLLAGTLRGELLDEGTIAEQVLKLHDLARAESLWFVNSLRGWVPITIEGDATRTAQRGD